MPRGCAADGYSPRPVGGNIPSKANRGQQPLAALVKGEIARWTPIIKAANVRPE